MTGLVIGRGNGSHVRAHDAGEQIGVTRAPFIVITAPFIGSGDINGRGEGLYTARHTAFTLDQIGGIGLRIPAKLTNDRALVTDQPFVIDLIVDGMTVGDDPVAQGLAGRVAIDAIAAVRRCRQNAVGTQHPLFRRSRPDHILAQKPAVRKLGQRCHGGGDHPLIADHNRARRTDRNVRRVIIMKCRDAAPFPDFGGNAENVMREICPFRIKTLHLLTPS